MSVLSKVFGRRRQQPPVVRTTANSPYRIPKPVVGFVCVAPEHQALMDADKAAIGPIFAECRSSTGEVVPCHILFLYCNVDKTGSLPGLSMRIRDFVKASGACIAVVASENSVEHYTPALKPGNGWPANIALVVDRRGASFEQFYQKLFQAMKGGTSMLMAWVRLAPQNSNRDHTECPVSLMLAEAGHVAFGEST